MSSAYQTVPAEGLEIITSIPGVEEGYYNLAFKKIDELPKDTSKNIGMTYEEARYFIANKIYLIYERLHHRISRQIDYGEIKRWLAINTKLVTLFLSDKNLFNNGDVLSLEVLKAWINSTNHADAGMSRTCMYKK